MAEAKINLIGIANCRRGVLDLFRELGNIRTVALPRNLMTSSDPDEITAWARREGLINRGEQVAVSEE